MVKTALLNLLLCSKFPIFSVYIPTELLILLITTKQYLLPKCLSQPLGEGGKLCVQSCVG